MKTRWPWWTAIGWFIPVVFLCLFYFYPLANIFGYSLFFNADNTSNQLFETLAASTTWKITWFTFWQALLSTFLTLFVGLPGAYLLARFRFRGKRIFQALTAVPFVMPTLVVAAAFNALLGPRGWMNLGLMALFDLTTPPIRFMNSIGAILAAHIFYNTTIVLRTVSSYWAGLDPRLEQAARTLGASQWQTFRRVTLPLLSPAVAVAGLLVFIFDFTSFGVMLVLGGPRFATLEVEIFSQALHFLNLQQAAALSLIQLAFTVGFTSLYHLISNRIITPLNLKPGSFTQQTFKDWKTRISAGVILALITVLLISPLVALTLRSFSRIETIGTSDRPGFDLSLDFYRLLNTNQRQSLFFASPLTAILISLGYAATTVVLSLGIGLPAAWLIAKSPLTKLKRLLDMSLMLPLGTSSITLGLGFILALNRPPIDLRTSIILVPLAHTLVALPFVVRNIVPALVRIQPRLHQAARTLGATPIEVLRFIDFPLISRALIVAATFAFSISLGEFGATSMLSRPEYPTIPIAIYRFLGQPGITNYGQALALSTLLMIVCAAGMLLIERFRTKGFTEF